MISTNYTRQSAPAVTSSQAPASPGREQDLMRQIDQQVSTKLSDIRQRIASAPTGGAPNSEGVGRILDIRA